MCAVDYFHQAVGKKFQDVQNILALYKTYLTRVFVGLLEITPLLVTVAVLYI